MSADGFDHPIRKGAILQRVHRNEGTEVLLEVLKRLRDIDDGHYEYELSCPTHTGYYTYRDEDIDDCFDDTGLTNEHLKPIGDTEIRALYQELHDELGEHSFHEVHERNENDELVQVGEQCIHCRKRRDGGEPA